MNKKLILILLTVVIVGVSTYILWPEKKVEENIVPEKFEYVDIEAKEAYKLISEDKNVVILDGSPRWAKGHIPNSINHYAVDGSLDKAIPTLNNDKIYLVYCHVDSVSILGAEKLMKQDLKKYIDLKIIIQLG